ncbi:metallophosphoesterase [Labedella endophytica]|uniref:Metallophosphoesterase n=1 Tax=Labedella endophytica TaxID=1523160 RepID=A0A3S0XLB8_9MICO|nr:metallophosphoesterase [Labedella endophytica]RUQ98997.1 metallophosphoesterase [Labedella endophytica]
MHVRSALASIGLAALVATTAAVPAASAASAASPNTCDSMRQDVRQSVNPDSQQSLLTASANETERAASVWGFTDQRGSVFEAASSQRDGLVPVYRLYENERFVWIPEKHGSDEIERAQSVYGWDLRKVDFWASPSPIDCGVGVHRLWSDELKTFRMEVDEARIADLTATGWRDQGARFWVSAEDDVTEPSPEPAPEPAPVPEPEPEQPVEPEQPTEPTPPVEPAPPAESPADADGVFSFAVIPDTQMEMGKTTRFADRTRWLVENKDALDLRYALHTGDVTNWGEVDPAQYTVASDAMKVLDDGGIPAAIAIGNHDTSAVCAGGKACPGKDARKTVRDTPLFNETFPASRYPNISAVYETGRVDNNVQTFSAGGADFLILTLELWPRVEVVEWAKDVVASHPDHNVIVNTHSYLESDASIMQSNGGYGATSPQYLYDELISQYANIRMVFSGHVGMSNQRTDVGVHGNTIASFLGGFHSPANPVKLVEVDVDSGSLTAKVFVPQTDTYETQYDATIDGIDFIQ